MTRVTMQKPAPRPDLRANHGGAEKASHEKDGTHGWTTSLGTKDQFKQLYREGFMKGYQEGYQGNGPR